MNNYSTKLAPIRILNYILCKPNNKEKVYIITGKPGPTGKTWLTNQLVSKGYNAIEISELICENVKYTRRGNSFIERNNIVLIILNLEVE